MPTNKTINIMILNDLAYTLGAGWTVLNGKLSHVSNGTDSTASLPDMALVDNNTYQLAFEVTNTVLAASDTSYAIQLGAGTEYSLTENQVWADMLLQSGATVASGMEISSVNTTVGDTFDIEVTAVLVTQPKPSTNLDAVFVSGGLLVDEGGVNEAPGPIDEYPWDEFGDYGEDPGMFNGQRVYKSANTHADGSGGLTHFYVRMNAPEAWWIAGAVLSTPQPRWSASAGVGNLIGDYNPNGATGTATVTYGPTDHETATGSPGLETTGVAPSSIDLMTDWDYLNGLRAGKFGIVSIYENDPANIVDMRLVSAETSAAVGYNVTTRTSPVEIKTVWSASGGEPIVEVYDSEDGVIRNNVLVCELATLGDAWIFENGVLVDDDITVSGLDACLSSKITLGSRGYTLASLAKAKFGFHSVLDFTSVVPAGTWADWSLGLSEAINTAAVASNYNPHSIAAAIFAYDANITGVYWALDELSAGDASSYYLLAYDITDGSAKTSEFYGLVSTSGVTGTSLVSADGGGGRRGRYTGGGRYAGFRRSRYN